MFRTSRLARSSESESANRRLDFGIRHFKWRHIARYCRLFLCYRCDDFYCLFSGCAMRYLNWILRVVLFIALLGFAVKNDQPITLHYFFGYEWQSSLVLVLLIFFAAGMAVGVLAMLVNVLQQRREISVLKREIRVKDKLAGSDETQQAT